MTQPPAPQIQPGAGQASGFQFQVIGYADPQHFPFGLDVTLAAPGSVVPVGVLRLEKGCLICVLPPDVSRAIIAQVALQQNPPGPGQVKAPGLSN